jgi:hypothetical protein
MGTHLRQRGDTRCSLSAPKALLLARIAEVAATVCNLAQPSRDDKMSENAKFILGFG